MSLMVSHAVKKQVGLEAKQMENCLIHERRIIKSQNWEEVEKYFGGGQMVECTNEAQLEGVFTDCLRSQLGKCTPL